jgi:hypothetical protein
MCMTLRKACGDRNSALRPGRLLAIAFAAASLGGCTVEPLRDTEPLLKRPHMSAGSVVLDAFVARFPSADPKLNGPAWREIDELRLPAAVRRRLLANGFRVGVLTGQLPDELTELLSLADTGTLPGEVHTLQAAELAKPPRVVRGHFQLAPGMRKELPLGPTRDELPVLLGDAAGGSSGETYRDAQTLLAVRSHPLPDGRVRLDITPEIAHGQWTRRWDMDEQGVFHVGGGRTSRVFEHLRFEVVLAPGHTLVMSTAPSRQASVGGEFFSEPSGDQMLLLVRLSQTQHDGALTSSADQKGE